MPTLPIFILITILSVYMNIRIDLPAKLGRKIHNFITQITHLVIPNVRKQIYVAVDFRL
jgi:hypothetical protein